jgi:outer membrane lipoprotein-sorting protein
MKRRSVLALVLALSLQGLVSSQDSTSDETKKFLKDWADRTRDVKTLHVELTQTKELKILRRPLVSRGVVWLKGPRLLMTIDAADGTRDTELEVDSEKGVVRIHYPRQKRVEVFEIGKGTAPETPFPFFGGDVERLPETRRVSLEHEKDEASGEERSVLVLVPREAGATSETRLTFSKGQVVRVKQSDSRTGEKLTIEISKFETGVEVPDERVRLVVPEGTTVVHPLSSK